MTQLHDQFPNYQITDPVCPIPEGTPPPKAAMGRSIEAFHGPGAVVLTREEAEAQAAIPQGFQPELVADYTHVRIMDEATAADGLETTVVSFQGEPHRLHDETQMRIKVPNGPTLQVNRIADPTSEVNCPPELDPDSLVDTINDALLFIGPTAVYEHPEPPAELAALLEARGMEMVIEPRDQGLNLITIHAPERGVTVVYEPQDTIEEPGVLAGRRFTMTAFPYSPGEASSPDQASIVELQGATRIRLAAPPAAA